MYCKNCGKEIDDNTAVCPYCNYVQETAEYQASVNSQRQQIRSDSGNIGWGFLGCCIPIVGLIIFLVWHDKKPNTAKTAGIGALIAVVVSVLLGILNFAIQMMTAMMMY